ncbi:FAD/NAD(P)-binding protein [Thiohalobacter thiocyanaticus]|uniref:Ni/Fe hydrogenase subunit gamma n=1 Tax=Thiohalobacter thiocyanaticus TaxID=585455 RepID=A0A426QM77_9GAMM|nr:FAD/NAD(P)-binding protein [Thiohalobacter thiocyanaticus]RRQ22864.1 Ni/Fe hydrogenase subunit gamma [Thiohalobacter thiocyanaticus]
MNASIQVPWQAEVVSRVQETPSVFTLGLRLDDPAAPAPYRFAPGQFNMLYLYGVGEVPISVVSDPEHDDEIQHTVRAVGRVTHGLAALHPGDQLGLRGPFGRGWPLEAAVGRDLLLVTGGLGCAPVVSVINYAMQRRERFGRLGIVQGVKHMDDLIWRERYEAWAGQPDTQVQLAADVAGSGWNWHVGLVTDLFDRLGMPLDQALVMLCGPEPMMIAAIRRLLELGVEAESVWLSMERNMQCAVGLCGHCQYGKDFLCRQGPVFNYPDIRDRLGVKGF